jgi:hypothetical protein
MDFYKKLKKTKTWVEFIEFLESLNLQILDYRLSLIDKIRRFLNFSYNAKIIIGNEIVRYEINADILEADKIYMNIWDIKVI